MKLRANFSVDAPPPRIMGEQRLARAIIYRALRDILNFSKGVCSSESKLSISEVKTAINWINSDSEHPSSFLFWVGAASLNVGDRDDLIKKCRKFVNHYKFIIDSNRDNPLLL